MTVADEPGRRAAFPGSSQMAARMREFDWASSPLGEPASWPASLASAVRICLTSRFPMIVWWGPELRFLYNDAYLPLLGTKHPALAKPGAEVWGEIWHIIGPMLADVLATGEATWSEDLLLPMNRHGYWEETYWTYSYSPVHDDDGSVRAVFTAVADTTERVIGERRLATLREIGAQAGIARTVGEACAVVAEILGRAGEDVPFAAIHVRHEGTGGVALAAVTPGGEDVAGKAGWPLREVLADGVPRDVTGLAAKFGELPAGGWSTSPAEAMVLPLTGDAGAPATGVIVLAASAGHALDESYRTFLGLIAQQTAALVNGAIAYQVQQERAEGLAALDAAKTTFFANISHEFRTPLTLILGPVAELREQLRDAGEAVREEVDVIHRNALRLGRLVNNLLDFSRIEAGRMQARFEPVDLAAFTAELASVFRAAVERAGLAFEVDCPPLDEPVHVDREMWEKVVLNLLSNAVKYTFDGTIRVGVGREDAHAVVTVTDTGIGIADDELPRLFERFHRIPSARARSNEGSGIGLALVRELVGMHGGAITAESTPGAGTTFRIRLPLGARHLPTEQVAPELSRDEHTGETAEPFVQEALRWLSVPGDARADDPAPAAAPGARVLIADDNADMRDYLGRLLRDDYAVTSVHDGVEAFAAACGDPPDLIISDVMMPRMDGLRLLAELRGDPRTAAIPVVLLSARAGHEAAVDGLAAGADDYLVKPFSARELLARVRTTIQLARLRTQHTRWRAAMIDSLQEGFFVGDADGRVVEINAAFTELLGFGTDGLPYGPPFPWLPGAETDPGAHQQVLAAVARMRAEPGGSFEVPLRHRDGHRVWAAVAYNELQDDEGRRRLVGTVRDVTAERYAVQRESALASMNQRLAGVSGVPDVLRTALELLRDLWHADRVLAVTWPRAGEPELASTDPADGRWAGLAAPVRATLDRLRSLPALHAAPAGSAAGGAGTTVDHPGGQLTLWVEPAAGRPFGTEDQTLLALLAGTLAQALRRAHRDDRQREVALALQRSILGPALLPDGFAVRYEPANPPLEVGGDWYDVISLDGDRIGIVVGDCVGRGLPAAAVMGQLRSACRALLLEANSPSHTLTALDRFAGQLPGALCTTVFCGVLDPATGRLTYSSAGHPPATLVHRDGTAQSLDAGGGVPLAVRVADARPEATAVVPIGSLLMLYTDGLVERRRESLDTGIDRATGVVHEALDAELADLAATLMSSLRPEDGYEDDVALLLYRRTVPPLAMEFEAHPDSLASIRHWLRAWLGTAALDEELAQDILVAAGEACANAVEHAYVGGSGAKAQLSVRLSGDLLVVAVTDQGKWKQPPPDNQVLRGRGMPMMEALSDGVTVRHDAAGTTVTLEWRIGS